MKRLLLFIPIIICSITTYAQTDCSKNHPVYRFDKPGSPKDVYKLGADPEFPFLRNLSTPRQVLSAMQNKANAKQRGELNELLMEAGFARGIKDVKEENITAMDVTPGTTGNMGDGHFHYMYAKFAGSTQKAWRVASGTGCFITFLSPCGNAFFPGNNDGMASANTFTGNKPGCKDLTVSTEPREMMVDGVAEQHVTKKTYIYYEERNCCSPCGDCCGHNSKPLLTKTEDVVEMVPTTYKVTTNGTGHATVCNDTVKSISSDLSIENASSYTGNMPPKVKKEYVKVSEREYWQAKYGDNCGCEYPGRYGYRYNRIGGRH